MSFYYLSCCFYSTIQDFSHGKITSIPLFRMNIAFYLSLSVQKDKPSFIVETCFLLARQYSEHTFIIITDQELTEQFSFCPNIETILVKPLSKNAFLKKIWWDMKLPGILKKVKADVF